MADPNLQYDPIEGWENSEVFVTNPANQPATRSLFQRLFSQIQSFINSTMIPWTKDLDSANVKKTGDQSIDGVKTFTSSPIVPTPTTDMQASTKKYVDDVDSAKKTYVDDNFTTKTDITTNRKLSATGNFTGTINGLQPIQVDPYVSATVAEHSSQLADIAINISQYPRIVPETDDAPRFTRAITALTAKGGGTLQLKVEEYTFNSGIVVPDNVKIKGQGNSSPWVTSNVTLFTYTGNTGALITVQSEYEKKALLSEINIRCTSDPIANSNTIGILILNDSGEWGGSLDTNKISIYNFGIGILHAMTYQCNIKNTTINKCGIGVSFNPSKAGINASGAHFGNVNIYEKSTIYECNIGVEFACDIDNIFKNSTIESCYIGIQIHSVTGYLTPGLHRFEGCWFELNGKDNPFTVGDQADRYLICNSDVDSSFTATNTNTVPIANITFVNCRQETSNVSPSLPSFNTNYDIWSMDTQTLLSLIPSDSSMTSIFNRTQTDILNTLYSNGGTVRKPFSLSNKGFIENRSLNGRTYTKDYTGGGAGYQQVTSYIDIGDDVSPDAVGVTPAFAHVGLLTIFVKRSNGSHANAVYLYFKIATGQSIFCYKIGETLNGLESIAVHADNGSPTIMLNVIVSGDNLQTGTFKINYFPNGLMAP